MTKKHTKKITVNTISLETYDILNELKTLNRSNFSQVVDEIAAYYVEHNPAMAELQKKANGRLAAEYSGDKATKR